MIKLTLWDRLYVHTFDWVLRRMEPDCLEMYNDKEQDWVEAIKAFNKVQLELFDKYAVTYKSGNSFKKKCIKGLELTADQLFDLFHKHLNQYTNKTVRDFIFHWWNDLRPYIKDAEPPLDQAYLLFKPATKEEIEYARKTFSKVKHIDYYSKEVSYSTHTFDDDARVLDYRGYRFIIDKEWGDAWTLDKNGEPISFRLDWDWWYPIDMHLDLYSI